MIVTYCTIVGGQIDCNMLYLISEHVFQDFGGTQLPIAPLFAGLTGSFKNWGKVVLEWEIW